MTDPEGVPTVVSYIRRRDHEALQRALKSNPSLSSELDTRRRTTAHFTVIYVDERSLQMLVKAKADVSARDERNESAFEYALRSCQWNTNLDHHSFMERMCSLAMDLTIEGAEHDQSALQLCIMYNYMPRSERTLKRLLSQKLITDHLCRDALMYSLHWQRQEYVDRMLRYDNLVRERDALGCDALHFALGESSFTDPQDMLRRAITLSDESLQYIVNNVDRNNLNHRLESSMDALVRRSMQDNRLRGLLVPKNSELRVIADERKVMDMMKALLGGHCPHGEVCFDDHYRWRGSARDMMVAIEYTESKVPGSMRLWRSNERAFERERKNPQHRTHRRFEGYGCSLLWSDGELFCYADEEDTQSGNVIPLILFIEEEQHMNILLSEKHILLSEKHSIYRHEPLGKMAQKLYDHKQLDEALSKYLNKSIVSNLEPSPTPFVVDIYSRDFFADAVVACGAGHCIPWCCIFAATAKILKKGVRSKETATIEALQAYFRHHSCFFTVRRLIEAIASFREESYRSILLETE